MKTDIGETKNVAVDNPLIVNELTQLLDKIKNSETP